MSKEGRRGPILKLPFDLHIYSQTPTGQPSFLFPARILSLIDRNLFLLWTPTWTKALSHDTNAWKLNVTITSILGYRISQTTNIHAIAKVYYTICYDLWVRNLFLSFSVKIFLFKHHNYECEDKTLVLNCFVCLLACLLVYFFFNLRYVYMSVKVNIWRSEGSFLEQVLSF